MNNDDNGRLDASEFDKWQPLSIEDPLYESCQENTSEEEEYQSDDSKLDDSLEISEEGGSPQGSHQKFKSETKSKFHLTMPRVHPRHFSTSILATPSSEEQHNGRRKLTRRSKIRRDFDRNFTMIKYPRRASLGAPNDRLFKLDTSNMQIIWKRNQHSTFQTTKSLSLHKVIEVREGQRTDMFDKFSFEQAESQSFSLIYQQEDKRYASLTSLNLICDHPKDYDLWIKMLTSRVSSRQLSCAYPKLSSEDNNTTDSTILWLRQLWSCEAERGVLSGTKAIILAKKLNPSVSRQYAKRIVAYAHQHQVESCQGLSLDFSGFVLMFNLLSGITENRLYSIYKEYAKTSPNLGMTLKEFREFLLNECCWKKEACKKSTLREVMKSHDFCHQAYKKYSAMYKPSDFIEAQKLISYPGFLSFIRSNDNSAIDPEHETVYQDMTQPLSHYFINSSHNTYLEGDQLKGVSTTDAYIRCLLQGCRCVEIDCWDDTFNVTNLELREPVVYHGFTLTTKLPFREVIHTIKDHAFSSSNYPVFVSIENHCNKTQQKRMAKIFRAVFDEMLPNKDLVELENRARLPSPQELQGKIILKGSYKIEETKTTPGLRFTKRASSICSTSSSTNHSAIISVTPSFSLPRQQLSEDVIENFGVDFTFTPTSESTVDKSDTDSLNSSKTEKYSTYRRRFSSNFSLREIRQKVAESEHGQDDQELVFKETVEDLRSLIIYAKATSIKPWSWERQKATNVTQIFSFGEPTAIELCTSWNKDMLACTERQLVRTYPKGMRFDSSNYNPLQMWRCGVQMVALNFQTVDTYMHLNQGFFRQNGGCGYVLKPSIMRREDPGKDLPPFDPEMQGPHPDVQAIDLDIELISGQRLCRWKRKCSSVSVNIFTYGITHDCAHIGEATHNNALWPYWDKQKHKLTRTILMPELCLVYFRVEADKKLFAQNCIPVNSLQSGMKFIPLRTPGGELIPGSGLFIKVMKVLARSTVKQAGNSVADHEQEPPSHKLNRETPIFIIESNNETIDDENYKDDADTEGIDLSQKREGHEVVDGGLENTSDTQRLSCPALVGHTALRQ